MCELYSHIDVLILQPAFVTSLPCCLPALALVCGMRCQIRPFGMSFNISGWDIAIIWINQRIFYFCPKYVPNQFGPLGNFGLMEKARIYNTQCICILDHPKGASPLNAINSLWCWRNHFPNLFYQDDHYLYVEMLSILWPRWRRNSWVVDTNCPLTEFNWTIEPIPIAMSQPASD